MTTIIKMTRFLGYDHNNKDEKVLGVMTTTIKMTRFLGLMTTLIKIKRLLGNDHNNKFEKSSVRAWQPNRVDVPARDTRPPPSPHYMCVGTSPPFAPV